MEIIDMRELNEAERRTAATLLMASLPLGYPTMEAAMAEFNACVVPANIMLAVRDAGEIIAWGGLLAPTYDGRVHELHPLVVRADKRRIGMARSIVEALEVEARARGGLTLFLGADDEKEDGETSLAKVDLYDNLPDKLKHFEAGNHVSAFYQKLGFKIVGVMPDANGPGKPDIFLAKSR